MHELLFQYGFLILFILTFWGLGISVLKIFSVQIKNSADKIFYASVLGCAIGIILFSIIYLLQMYNTYYLYIFYLAAIPGVVFLAKETDRKSNILIIFILFLIFKQMVYTVYPPGTFDDTMYHLPIIEKFLHNEPIDFFTSIRYPAYPFFGEVFLSLGMVWGDIAAQVLSCYVLFLIAFGIGKEFLYCNYKKMIIAVTLLFMAKVLIDYSGIIYIDNIVALFVLAAFLVIKDIYSDEKELPIYFAGIFMGIAIGIKYTAGFCAIEMGIILLGLKKWRPFFKYSISAAVVGCIWYIRNYFMINNPLWPFLHNFFLTRDIWSYQDYQLQFLSMMKKHETVVALFKDIVHSEGGISFYIILGIILYCISYKRQKWFKIYLGVTSAYFIMWYNSAQYTRYLMPIVPILVIMAVNGYVFFINKFKCSVKIYKVLVGIILCNYIIVSGSFVFDYFYNKDIIWKDNIKKYHLAVSDRDKFLKLYLPGYTAIDYAADLPGKTFALHQERLNYYGKGKVYGDWFGRYRYKDVEEFLKTNNYNGLKKHLKNLGITYLMITKSNLIGNNMIESVYSDGVYYIYKIN